jgi:Fe2+ or Zn2+ uptake regulation protein
MQNTLEQRFVIAMRASGLKITPVRREVFAILCRAERPLLPQEIVARVTTADQSSVYRNLPLLARHKIARKVSQGFKTLYELGDNFTSHQHYAVCERCGRSVKIEDRRLERLIGRVTRAAGMEPTGHFVELLGICERCRQKSPSSEGD